MTTSTEISLIGTDFKVKDVESMMRLKGSDLREAILEVLGTEGSAFSLQSTASAGEFPASAVAVLHILSAPNHKSGRLIPTLAS